MNSSVDNALVNVHECEKCLTLETGLLNKNDFIEKVIYDKLFKSFTTLEKRCISLEVDTQLNQEIFQRDNSVSNQSAPSFDQLFELNELKAQSQEKDTVIKKLKERIKSLRVKSSTSASMITSSHQQNTKKDKDSATTKPTGRTFSIVGNACPLTRITTTTEVPLRKPIVLDNEIPKPFVTLVYSRKPRTSKTNVTASKSKVIQIVLWYLDSGCSKHMNEDRSQLTNFVYKFLEELGHNLFSIMQLCDLNLEVAFRQHTYFIGNLEGVDLMTGFRGNNLYTLSLGDIMASSPICLLSKASKTKSWLWHRRLSHLNFAVINHLARHGLVRGLPKLKFEKDHLCSACAMGKSKKKTHKPKSIFCTWIFVDQCVLQVLMERSTSSSLLMITLDLHRIDNGTEFVNQTLREYYEKVGISHETSVARSPQQNGVVERCNRTLIEAAPTMLIYAKAPLFLWVEVVATVCYTQNHSVIRLRHDKTPYELLHDKLPDLSFFHVFGALCYPKNDSENLGKRIIKTIHVDIDKLTAMASEHISSGPALHDVTPTIISSGLMPNPHPLTQFIPPSRTD
ncbi:retrovirus-related pol polyprotein from transposon TNT 1-94 [Tanacetum coccineum]